MIFIDESLRASAARRAPLLAQISTLELLENRKKNKENGSKEERSRARERWAKYYFDRQPVKWRVFRSIRFDSFLELAIIP